MFVRGFLVAVILLTAAVHVVQTISSDLESLQNIPAETACPRLYHIVKLNFSAPFYILAPTLVNYGACSPGCEPKTFMPLEVVVFNNGDIDTRVMPEGFMAECKPTA